MQWCLCRLTVLTTCDCRTFPGLVPSLCQQPTHPPRLDCLSLSPSVSLSHTYKHAHYILFLCFCLVAQLCLTLCNPMDCSPPGSSVHGDSPGKNTGVGSHTLLQGIFPTQGSNPGLPHGRWILYHLSHPGKPKNTGVGSLSFSRESSQTWHQTWVSRIAVRFFTS